MAVSTIKKGVTTEILTGTTGTSQYTGYYYCDLTTSHPIANLLGAFVASAQSNRPAFVQQAGSVLRVYCPISSTAVTVVALF